MQLILWESIKNKTKKKQFKYDTSAGLTAMGEQYNMKPTFKP